MNAPMTLDQLAAAWQAAKADEKAANVRRLEIEEQIVKLFPVGFEGTDTIEEDGFKVSVTYKLTRSVDSKALEKLWPRLSEKAQSVFKWEAAVRVAELRKVHEFLPESYALISTVITAKPAKPSVEVTLKAAA